MREVKAIPRNALFRLKREKDFTVKEMASYCDVPYTTMETWLYKQSVYNMSQASYGIMARKLGEANIAFSEPALQIPEDIMLPLIAVAIKGETEACWLHYVCEVYPHDSQKEKEILLRYARVFETTLRRWLNFGMPDGQNLLRLRCFLGHRGYGVAELEGLHELLKVLVYLIADWKVPIAEVVDKVCYRQRGALLQVLLGNSRMSNERLDICRDLIAKYRIVNTTREEEFVRDDEIKEVPLLVKFSHEEAVFPIQRLNGACRWEVENLAAMVRMMLPLAEKILSDAYSEKEREQLRALANGDGVFRLSNALNGLCGPRIRLQMINKQEGE